MVCSSTTVMVLDGHTRSSLAIVRALGKQGVDVIVGAPHKQARALFSRYAKASFVYDVDDSCERMHATILKAVKRSKPTVLFPVMTRTFSIVIERRDEYELYTKSIPLPGLDAFRNLDNKRKLYELSQKLQIEMPATWVPTHEVDLHDIAQKLVYPVLLKPCISAGGFCMCEVLNPEDLSRRYNKMKSMQPIVMSDVFFDGHMPIIQEKVAGDVVTFFAYCETGVIKQDFMTKTIRNYPVPFGPGICVESISNAQVYAISEKLLRFVKWEGVIGLQFIIDARDRHPKLIDANPRFWGTVESALHAGVDFVSILLKKAVHKNAQHEFVLYQTGKRFRWLAWGEFLYVLQSRKKLAALKAFFSDWKIPNEIIFSDLMPHVAQVGNIVFRKEDFR